MLQTIFIYECKQLLRSKGLIAAILLFSGIGFFCLQQGKSVYQFQRVAVDSAIAKQARNYKKVQQVFDTLQYTDHNLHELEEPFSLEWRLQDVKAKTSSPLSILSIGQSDIYTPLMSGHFNRPVFKNDYTEFQNPEKLLAGNLDMAFFILFIFPLLFIALSYNIRSADNEAGIEPLLSAQVPSLRKLLDVRIFFRWIVALFPVLVMAAVSWLMLRGLSGFTYAAWLQWWGVAILYAAFWLVLGALLLRFHFSSLINAITMASIWVLLLIAMPGLINTWFNYQYPSTNKTELAEYRDYDFKAWDQPFEAHKAFLYERYPAYKQIKLADEADSAKFRGFSYSLMVFEKEKALYQQMSAQKNKLATAEQNSFWLNPIGGVMRSFATISKTGLQAQQQFEATVLAYREKKLKYLFEKLVTQPHFTKKDFEDMPKQPTVEGTVSISKYLLPLGLLTLLLAIYTRFKRK